MNYKNIYKIVFFPLLFLVLISCGSDYRSREANELILKNRHELVLCDTAGALTLGDILHLDSTLHFTDLLPEQRSSSGHYVYWLKVNFKRKYDYDILIELGSDYNKCNVYVVDVNKIRELSKVNNIKWRYKLANEDHLKTMYIRMETPGYLSGVGFHAYMYESLHELITEEMLYLGLIVGILFLCMIYTIFLYINLREKFYLYYFLYVLSFALYLYVCKISLHSMFGLSFVHQLYHYTIPFSAITIFLLQYARGFLQTAIFLPPADKFLLGLILIKVLMVVVGILANYPLLFHSIFDNIFIFCVLLVGVFRLRQGYRPARFFALGLSLVYLGMFIHSAFQLILAHPQLNIKINEDNIFSFFNFNTMEIVIFTIAIADRFKLLKTEKETAQNLLIQEMSEKQELIVQMNQNLEQMVHERTEALFVANQRIKEMNTMLEEDNRKLEANVTSLEKNAVMRKSVGFDDFKKIFPDEEACQQFLFNLKWNNGYLCKKCHHNSYCEGKMSFSLRCTRCGYEESSTTATIFYKIKFPLLKAFYVLFLVSENQEISAQRIAEMILLRRQTCDDFKKKIKERILTKRKPKNMNEGWSYLILDE